MLAMYLLRLYNFDESFLQEGTPQVSDAILESVAYNMIDIYSLLQQQLTSVYCCNMVLIPSKTI